MVVNAHVFTSTRHAPVRDLRGDKRQWERREAAVQRRNQSDKELVSSQLQDVDAEEHLLQHPLRPAGESSDRAGTVTHGYRIIWFSQNGILFRSIFLAHVGMSAK